MALEEARRKHRERARAPGRAILGEDGRPFND
jgi:hypothetical protein